MADLEERAPKPLYLICGMLKTKDACGYFSAFRGLARHVTTVAIPGEAASLGAGALYDAARAAGLEAAPADDLTDAMMQVCAWARAPRRRRPAAHSHLRLALSGGQGVGRERLIRRVRFAMNALDRCRGASGRSHRRRRDACGGCITVAAGECVSWGGPVYRVIGPGEPGYIALRGNGPDDATLYANNAQLTAAPCPGAETGEQGNRNRKLD